LARPGALERYREIPLPTTTEESWRFTDLKGFDPDSFASNGDARGQTPDVASEAMLEIDTAGIVTVSESGIEVARAPDGIRFEPLADHELLADTAPLPENVAVDNFRARALTLSLAGLSSRERRVLELRYGLDGQAPATLDEVGKLFSVTRERIRQIEKRSLNKLSASSEMANLRSVA